MKNTIRLKNILSSVKTSFYQPVASLHSLLISLGFGWICLTAVPVTNAVSPAPDGGYPGNNTAEGDSALLSLTGGFDNTAVGFYSLSHVTTGSFNTGVGTGALDLNTGNENTATGAVALLLNTTGANNTANGAFTLVDNSTGQGNTALGDRALQSNTTGNSNSATGLQALFDNLDGHDNTADGDYALVSNDHGSYNTAIGNAALFTNTGGNENTAVGRNALSGNTTGFDNTAIGAFALVGNTAGWNNIAVGRNALTGNTTGFDNIALGRDAGTQITGNNNIDIGAAVQGVAGENDTIRIGNGSHTGTYIAGIVGQIAFSGVPVYSDATGHLGTIHSSKRFKDQIKPMKEVSDAILALKPVTFHYKTDKTNTPQFGLVAEDVAEVNPDLVMRDRNGEIYTVRYDAVNVMMLNEFLKEHKKVEEQQATIADLKSTVARQQKTFQSSLAEQEKQIEALTTGLQKVSAQLEMRKEAPLVVANRYGRFTRTASGD